MFSNRGGRTLRTMTKMPSPRNQQQQRLYNKKQRFHTHWVVIVFALLMVSTSVNLVIHSKVEPSPIAAITPNVGGSRRNDLFLGGEVAPGEHLEKYVQQEKIVGDVESLVDFAILGFEEAQIGLLAQELERNRHIKVLFQQNISLHMRVDDPASTVRDVYELAAKTKLRKLPWSQHHDSSHNKTNTDKNYRLGVKVPAEVRRAESLEYLRTYLPDTRLVIIACNPLTWLKSNFFDSQDRNYNYKYIVSTWKSAFHKQLAQFGKTPMSSAYELGLLQGEDHVFVKPPRMKNKIFFAEIGQLASMPTLRRDLVKFLGVEEDPTQLSSFQMDQARALLSNNDFDLCSDALDPFRRELLQVSRDASQWIRKYFLKSDDVFVSSREALDLLLLDWMQDPCEGDDQDDALITSGNNVSIPGLVEGNKIVGDVQGLLDFAILGFGKCGTTSLIRTLGKSSEVMVLSTESYHLQNDDPASLVRDLNDLAVSTERSSKQYHFGIKNPTDIRRKESLELMRRYWPNTKLVIAVRHPMSWFKSLYDFVHNEMGQNTISENIPKLVTRETHNIVSTWKGEFHKYLAQLGKTDMTLKSEIDLLHRGETTKFVKHQKMKNKVFFLEMTQLSDDNATRAEIFRKDLGDFLALDEPLGALSHVRPGAKKLDALSEGSLIDVDLCSRVFRPVRRELMQISRDASKWIIDYFLKSDDVQVSSREYLIELIMNWRVDPCGDIAHEFPKLDELVYNRKIIGNVEHLLDFAIVGFGKCGTTSLMRILQRSPEVGHIGTESHHLTKHNPSSLVEDLYALEQGDKTLIYGIKNPSDIRRPSAMSLIKKYFPKTKLVVVARHPVLWFKSLYDFYHNEMGKQEERYPIESFLNQTGSWIFSTFRAEFHSYVAMTLGKTPMQDQEELSLLSGGVFKDGFVYQRVPNKIFFVEFGQIADDNEGRAEKFRRDYAKFLNLTVALQPMPHVRPGESKKDALTKTVDLKICSKRYSEVRKELMSISRHASHWFRKYFLASDDVVVSNKKHVKELLMGWMDDPCKTGVLT